VLVFGVGLLVLLFFCPLFLFSPHVGFGEVD